MRLTVWGEAGGPDGVAATYNRSGQLTSARSYRELDLELPADGVEVDCDHDEVRVGELVWAELGSDNRLRAVCVLDDDRLAEVDEPVFYSPTFVMRSSPEALSGNVYVAPNAELIGLSLTFRTARLGALPLSWRAGDIRESVDRFKWPISWATQHPLLERAAASAGPVLRIHKQPEVLRLRGGAVVVDGELVAPSEKPLAGGWRRAGARGKVLRVS